MNKAQQSHYQSLYHKHVNALIRQGKAKSTIDVYARAIRRITEFYDRSPDRLSRQQIEDYFCQLVKSHSWSTVKVDRNGLQFFFKHILRKQWDWVDIVKPPKSQILPDVLTVHEIETVINGTRELRYQTYILTAYSMGLRLGEALNLTVGDIDSDRMRVHVRQGKGKKDRYVTLPVRSLQALRQYWVTHRNPQWLFPAGKNPAERCRASAPMGRGGLQKSFRAIVTDCGIRKPVTIHTLRHCYGTHLVEAGLHLRTIQGLMGHESPKTTALYTQLTEVVQQDARERINHMVNRLQLTFHGEV